MKCPYCGDGNQVHIKGAPSVKMLLELAPVLGLGVMNMLRATALVTTFLATHKMIYKCNKCGKHFIA